MVKAKTATVSPTKAEIVENLQVLKKRNRQLEARLAQLELMVTSLVTRLQTVEEDAAKYQDDLNTYTSGVITLEDRMDFLDALVKETYNPYNKRPVHGLKKEASQSVTPATGGNINITIQK